MFNWKDFKNGEFYVEVTEKNIENFLSECENQGLKWRDGDSPLDFIPEFRGKINKYIAHNLITYPPIFKGLSLSSSIKSVEKTGLPFVKWCDYATESEDQEEEQEQEETPQPFNWIPCSERLPEKSGDYLTALTDGRYEVLHYSVRYSFYGVYDEISLPVKVIAWAEIPPYKSKE